MPMNRRRIIAARRPELLRFAEGAEWEMVVDGDNSARSIVTWQSQKPQSLRGLQ